MRHKIFRILILLPLLYCAFVQAAPVQFNLTDLKGKNHTIQDYAGKWLIVNYWATWCPPCLEEIPGLVEFHEKHRAKDAVVLGINYENGNEKYLREFVEQHFISYPVARVRPGSPSPFGAIRGLPTTFLISPEGEVVASKTGGVTIKELEDSIAYFNKQSGNKHKVRR